MTNQTQRPTRKRATAVVSLMAALGLVAAACGSDKKSADTTAAPTTAAATTTAAAATTAAPTTAAATTAASTAESTEETTAESTAESTEETTAESTAGSTEETTGGSTAGGEGFDLDTNGDGKVVIGVATPGPRDDGGYYQALVDGVTKFSKDNGFSDPIIVDNIAQDEAASQLDALARQGVDMITVGAGEIGDPLPDLTAKYDKIVWYCNCGAGVQAQPNLIQSADDGSENGYTAGVATGLLMKAKGATKAAMIGNNNFNFEVEAFESFKLGLQSVDPSFQWTYVATNSFNDVAAATEAFNNLKDQGVGAIWPYLGGSHEAVVKLSNENDIITMSAGAANVCDRTDLKYDIAVKFDAGQYISVILNEVLEGKLHRGDTRMFSVGKDPQVGAVICHPTPDEQAAMDKAYEDVASGKLADAFGQVKAKAYGGG
jgi:basic membrane protein A